MKKAYALILVFVVILVALSVGYADQNPEPGSQQDPLVSKSYVDSQYNQVKAYVDDKLKEAKTGASYEVVKLNAGEVLTMEGGTQAIVRIANSAVIVTKTDGVADLTAGTNLKDNDLIPANHLLLFPRSDGRGIKATKHTYIVVMGKYTKN
ncbi:hypothetical protein SAMN04244560_01057 [Thermoanaerobacter thermohydrosulfuricus]|uniref:Uncharacterized protein n=1 Tax=Thermoanaerobacter thermohydrosulfuricus TaxID=1516 RepID=A0A1G7N284_THETY|nr:hypothetical protein [Thermoanaerobacter thermohydrosulfuricus]SDF68072.1 hypothetical protein SAMN04244560_01057 [Thermoanaerobacter thermohydrosulfuricus]